MSEKNDWGSGIIIWTLLFVGFCGLIGLAGTIILSIPLLFTTGFVVLAIGGLASGFILLKRHPRKLNGFCPNNVSAEPPGHRDVSVGNAIQALSLWDSRKCVTQHIGECERTSRLENIRRFRTNLNKSQLTTPGCRRARRRRRLQAARRWS